MLLGVDDPSIIVNVVVVCGQDWKRMDCCCVVGQSLLQGTMRYMNEKTTRNQLRTSLSRQLNRVKTKTGTSARLDSNEVIVVKRL
jgi:hypothetical protein